MYSVTWCPMSVIGWRSSKDRDEFDLHFCFLWLLSLDGKMAVCIFDLAMTYHNHMWCFPCKCFLKLDTICRLIRCVSFIRRQSKLDALYLTQIIKETTRYNPKSINMGTLIDIILTNLPSNTPLLFSIRISAIIASLPASAMGTRSNDHPSSLSNAP